MTAFDIMILCKTHDVIRDVTSDLSQYRFAQAIDRLMDFTWHDFADWYIEIAKFEENSETKKVILQTVLTDLLALWHPFIPFVTEEIWQHLHPAQPLITSQFPDTKNYERFLIGSDAHITATTIIMEVIADVRTLRQEHHIPPNKKFTLIAHDDANTPLLMQYKKILTNLRTGIADIQLFSDTSVNQTQSITHTTTQGITFTIPLEDIVDFAHEKEKKVQEQIQLQKYIMSLEKKLSVEAFITNAPAEIIMQEKEKLHNAQKKISEITDYLTKLSSS
jgi:valyl-tRNA synthetase